MPQPARWSLRSRRTSGPRSSTVSHTRSDGARTKRPGRSQPKPGSRSKAARVEVGRAMSTYAMAAVEARTLTGQMVPMDASQAGEGKLAFTLRRPIGVVGAISPFNFPLNLVAHKIAPALAAGCAVVLKPASQTPLSALLLAELEDEAGLPPGWLNVVVGPSSEIGDVLVEDERVKLITFTGSGAVGWGIRERAAKKKVGLELGNATPVIVAADANWRTPQHVVPRTRSRSPGRAASRCSGSMSSGACTTTSRRVSCPRSRRSWSATRPTRRPTSARSSRPTSAIACCLDRASARRRGHDLDGWRARGRAPPPDGGGGSPARFSSACDEVFGPVCTLQATTRSTRRSSARTQHVTGSRPGSSRRRWPRPCTPRRARVRRSHGQRSADLPRRPDAVWRRQGIGQHARRTGLGCPRDDRGAAGRRPVVSSREGATVARPVSCARSVTRRIPGGRCSGGLRDAPPSPGPTTLS